MLSRVIIYCCHIVTYFLHRKISVDGCCLDRIVTEQVHNLRMSADPYLVLTVDGTVHLNTALSKLKLPPTTAKEIKCVTLLWPTPGKRSCLRRFNRLNISCPTLNTI